MSFRVVIIGAGIIGAAVAHFLARDKSSITIIDSSMPASGATSRSFAWINANHPVTQEYHDLRIQSIDAYRELEKSGLPLCLQTGGSLAWEASGTELDDQYRSLTKFGLECSIIDRKTFAQLEPEVANPPEHCLFSPSELAIDPVHATQTFLASATQSGAKLITGVTVDALIKNGRRVVGVSTSHGKIEGDMVVVAAGVNSAKLLNEAGIDFVMDNRPGLIVHTQPIRRCLHHLVLTPDVHVRQEADGRLVVGEIFSGDGPGKNQIGEDPSALADTILQRLQERLPTMPIQLGRILLGRRPVPADGFPAIGQPKNTQGLYLASSHSGITLAPIIGKLTASEILGGPPSPWLTAFRPDRKSLMQSN